MAHSMHPMSTSPTHVVISPVKNEATNMERLARSLIEQTAPPTEWIVVDNGSTDATVEIVESLARDHPWIRLMRIPGRHKRPAGG